MSLKLKLDKVYENEYSRDSLLALKQKPIDCVCKIYLVGKRVGKIVLAQSTVEQEDIDEQKGKHVSDYETSSFIVVDKMSRSFSLCLDVSVKMGDSLEIVCFSLNKYFTK